MGRKSPKDWQPPAKHLPPPFEHYELLEEVGRGGQGVVWEARSPRYPSVPLAIKLYYHKSMLEQFREEAKRTIEISHPSIARSIEFCSLEEHESAGWLPAALVMMLHEPSLHDVFRQVGGSLETDVG